MENKRFIDLKKIPLFLSILFWLIFYLLLLKFFNQNPEISSEKYKNIYLNYGMYMPIIFWLLSLISLYILLFIRFILRLNFLPITILLYFIVYWFFLILWIDLMFFESRLADFALVIINTFSIPIIVSSGTTILMVIALSFGKLKSK